MTPLWLAVTLPLVELACAGWLLRRTGRSRYPALIAYLLTEALWHFLAIFDYRISTRIGSLPRMVIRYAVVAEAFRLSRSKWEIAECVNTAKLVFAGIMLVTIAMNRAIHLSPIQSIFVFRQYYYMALAAALWALIARAGRWPMLEGRKARAYRYGLACWMTAIAIPGTFVTGGLGYTIFPQTPRTWLAVDILGYLSITAAVVVLGLSLGWQPQRKRPAVIAASANLLLREAA